MGFGQFVPLSRKTSLLAARCAGIKEITIRQLMVNMNAVTIDNGKRMFIP